MVEPPHAGSRGDAAPPEPPGDGQTAKHRLLTLLQGLGLSLATLGVCFGLLEGALALFGVKPVLRSTDPFVGFVSDTPLFEATTDADGHEILATASNKLVFFNRQEFPREKAPDTYRIFCVGGSTTYGRPYADEVSFCGWLRELLPAADPERRWEVINAGGISYASYRVARLMEELTRYDPDLFIVYSGHNEFLEERTYGALRDLPDAIKSAAGLLSHTRTWAALSWALQRPGAAPGAEPGGRGRLPAEVNTRLDRSAGPELYERDDALRDKILLHYRDSLTRMADVARAAGADVVFVAPASNLKDCSPFKSEHTAGLGDAERSRSRELLSAAEARIEGSAWPEALQLLDEALAIDSRHAELHYRRGKALIALGRFEEADAALRRARDEDVCPLRALSPLPEILAEVAADRGATLVDFESLIEQRVRAEQGYPSAGREYFLDHVHLTLPGNRALAVALTQALIELGALDPVETWGEAAIAGITARVEGRLDRVERAEALANLARVLVWAGKVEDADLLARRALAEAPELVATHADILAIISERQGDTTQTWQHLRSALNANPGSPQIHLQIGLEYIDRSNPGWNLEAAAAHLLVASVFMPNNDMAHQIFGLIMAERGRYTLAYPSLAEAVRLNPQNSEAKRALERLREQLGPEARDATPKVTLKRYPSGAPRQIVQARPDATGRYIPDGILTDWYETGEIERLLDYSAGVPHGVEVRWARDGTVTSRAEYRQGVGVGTP